MKPIRYSEHLKFRLHLREIPDELPRLIFEQKVSERYWDQETANYIAVGRYQYCGIMRDFALTYQETKDEIVFITLHPLKPEQKTNRIRSGRWKKL